MADDSDLVRVDRALLRLRRMWDAPAGIEHEGALVEGSTLLVCLAVAEGRAAGEVGVVEVAGALGVTHSTASRLVSRAVEAGMVRRAPSATDPRGGGGGGWAPGGRGVGGGRVVRRRGPGGGVGRG
ncbi:MarR family transcriptional regulator [Geodermatophilus sp. SYSU D00758]